MYIPTKKALLWVKKDVHMNFLKSAFAGTLMASSLFFSTLGFAAPSLETVCEVKIDGQRVSFRDWDKVTWGTSAPTESVILESEYQGPLHSLKKILNVQMTKGDMYYEVSMQYSELTDLEVSYLFKHEGGEYVFDHKKRAFSNSYTVANKKISIKCNSNN